MASDPKTLWSEFLDKCEFVYLTAHPRGVPLNWLEELETFRPDDPLEASLKEDLARVEFRSAYTRYLSARARASQLVAPKVPLRLVQEDPTSEPLDVLVTTGDWDRLGHYILERAGQESLEFYRAQQASEPIGVEAGDLPCRKLVVLPPIQTNSSAQLRKSCQKALAMASQIQALRVGITHVPSLHSALSDEFAAAEVVSAARDFLFKNKHSTLRISIFHRRNYPLYARWFQSLGAIASQAEDLPPPAPPRRPGLEGFLEEGRELVGNVAERLQEAMGAGRRLLEASWQPTYETRQAEVYLELGDHDGALALLGRYGDSGQALSEYLKSLILYDRYTRQREEADLVLARAGLERLLAEASPAPPARLESMMWLAFCYHVDGRPKLCQELLAQVGIGLRSLGRPGEATNLQEVAKALQANPDTIPFLKGTPSLPDPQMAVSHLFRQGVMAGG